MVVEMGMTNQDKLDLRRLVKEQIAKNLYTRNQACHKIHSQNPWFKLSTIQRYYDIFAKEATA